jgi:hypothetical protein
MGNRRRSSCCRRWRWADGDTALANAIEIAAFSAARIEGACGLKGQRCADRLEKPNHPAIAGLIDDLIKTADRDGYLIHSSATKKYGERSAPVGKRFGRMKTKRGFDERFVFHSIRHGVASMFKDNKADPNASPDIFGHSPPLKPTSRHQRNDLHGGHPACGVDTDPHRRANADPLSHYGHRFGVIQSQWIGRKNHHTIRQQDQI